MRKALRTVAADGRPVEAHPHLVCLCHDHEFVPLVVCLPGKVLHLGIEKRLEVSGKLFLILQVGSTAIGHLGI
jgi:hypothetical protein